MFGNGIAAADSVVTAVACFGLTPHSYELTIANAILLGGDTDTIAAMAGAISGAFLGRQAIPQMLVDRLEDGYQGRTYIEQLAERSRRRSRRPTGERNHDMNAEQRKQISKRLSYVLRHRPDAIGIDLEEGGWVEVELLLAALGAEGESLSREKLQDVVATSDKQRFELSADSSKIRARQGHSVEVELGYEPAVPPEVLYHGTARHNLESILQTGLNKGRRHHVHLSTNRQTMVQVAMRHGQPVVLAIAAARMHAAGHPFFITGNQVWLTDHVPPQYLSLAEETPD